MKTKMRKSAGLLAALLLPVLIFGSCDNGTNANPEPEPESAQSLPPAAEETNAAKGQLVQKSVDFTLTSTHTGAWKVYPSNTAANPLSSVTAVFDAPVLTLTSSGPDLTAASYFVSVTAEGKTESERLRLTVEAYDVHTTAAPTTDESTVFKTSVIQKTVDFTLTSTHTGVWKVYATNTIAAPLTSVTAVFNPPVLTLTSSGNDLTAAAYYVSVTEGDLAESTRLRLQVGAYVPPGQSATPVALLWAAAKASKVQKTVDFTLTSSHTGTWNVYDVSGGGSPLAAVSADFNTNTKTLTLTASGNDLPGGAYYVTVTEDGKTESDRLELVVESPLTTPVIRYEVNAAGDAFTATPLEGASWNAGLTGVTIKTLSGRRVIDLGVNGFVDLGAKAGEIIKSLNEFTIETYVNIPKDSNLNGSGHFIWTFASQDPDTAAPTAASGRYMYLQASTQRFAISKSGWNNEQKTADNGFIERGKWKHVVLTRLGNTAALYIDGAAAGTKTLTVGNADLGALEYNYLGKPGFKAFTFNPANTNENETDAVGDHYLRSAQYYRVSVYNKAFTAAQIAGELGAAEILAAFPAADSIALKPNSTPMKHASDGVYALHTEEDFARIKAKIAANAQPWLDGWNKLKANSRAQTTREPAPVEVLVRGGTTDGISENYSRAFNDAAAAYQLAIRWKISGDNAFAAQGIKYLNEWAAMCTKITGTSDQMLAAGLYGYQFAIAGEILRSYSGWNAADFTTFKNWMVNLWYPKNHDFLTRHNDCYDDHYWANWDLCNLASVTAIGILADRRDIYNEAVEYLQNGIGNGNIYKFVNYIHTIGGEELGQVQEAGRDQGHATLCIGLMDVICQLTYNQGDDFYGFEDNRFLKAVEYTAKYNIALEDVPFTVFTRYWGNRSGAARKEVHVIPSVSARSTVRPIWAGPYNHYAKVKGVDASKVTYALMGVNSIPVEGGGGDYGSTSGGFDQLGFGTLMYTR